MVDSGSGPNLLNRRSVQPSISVDVKEILRLTGITPQHVFTRGLVVLEILEQRVLFHLVDNDFPIAQEGIIGSDFL